MKAQLAQKLKVQGWTEEEISKVTSIMDDIEKDKPQSKVTFGKIVYWTGLLVAIIGNLVLSVVLIPFMVILNEQALYAIIALLALGFGFLFNLLIKDIDGLDKNHHIIAGLFIPAIAIINVYVMVYLANYVIKLTGLARPRSPLIISVVYVVSFMLPYLLDRMGMKMHRRASV